MHAESSDSKITCGDSIVVLTGFVRFDITKKNHILRQKYYVLNWNYLLFISFSSI